MSLSPRDKLSLAITSAGSMRKLAALVGSSHQQIGRWLTTDPERQSAIPDKWNKAIDTAFKVHVAVTKDQARAQGLPYIAAAPVFQRLGYSVHNGNFTTRVITERTEHLSTELRRTFLQGQFRSQRFIRATARSIVKADLYAKPPPHSDHFARDNWVRDNKHAIKQKSDLAIYTKKGLFKNLPKVRMSESAAVNGIMYQLRQRHEPSAVALGDKMLFELDVIKHPKPTLKKGANARKQAATKRPARARPKARAQAKKTRR